MEDDKRNVTACECETEVKKEKKDDTKKEWKKPTLDDVSGQVMAQPYIRFT